MNEEMESPAADAVQKFADLIYHHGLRAPDSTLAVIAFKEVTAGWRPPRGPVTDAKIECPHWAPGRMTMRSGCTSCAALEAARAAE